MPYPDCVHDIGHIDNELITSQDLIKLIKHGLSDEDIKEILFFNFCPSCGEKLVRTKSITSLLDSFMAEAKIASIGRKDAALTFEIRYLTLYGKPINN